MKFITNTHDLEKYLEIKIRKYSSFKNISIDTRKIKKNSLFFAIKGDNFNGNDFAEDALKNGALTAFVDDKKFINNTNQRIIYVKDTIQTLRKICRNIIKNYDGKVIAITGSNGKTTTTNIIAKTLDHSSSTIKNFNNQIGLPLSILNSSRESKYLVYEIGASKLKDIDYLSKILNPHIGIITNIGHSHLEHLKNIEGVLKVKSEIISNIKKNGCLIVPNYNQKHLAYWRSIRDDIDVITFGLTNSADFYPSNIKLTSIGIDFCIESKYLENNIQISSNIEGKHNVMNILASCAAHYYLKKDLNEFSKEINSLKFVVSRLKKSKWINNSTLIDDTYNANPDSTKKSIDLLSNYNGKTYLILGDMLELGRYKRSLHKEVGQYAYTKKIDTFIGFGELTKYSVDGFGKNGIFFDQEDELKDYLIQNISKNDVILIKGSRGMRMERFINV